MPSNIQAVIASLQAQKAAIPEKVETAANRCLVIGVQEVQARCPVDTSNLKNSYPRCSTVEVEGAKATITFTSDVDYQAFVELGTSKMAARPHLAPGIFAAEPKMKEEFANTMRE